MAKWRDGEIVKIGRWGDREMGSICLKKQKLCFSQKRARKRYLSTSYTLPSHLPPPDSSSLTNRDFRVEVVCTEFDGRFDYFF